jgi:hypothetical protein
MATLPSSRTTQPFLIEVWRRPANTSRLAEAAARILPHLTDALPIGELLVRELDLSRHAIETIAIAPGGSGVPAVAHGDLRADELDAILAWCRGGGFERTNAGALRRRLPGLLPASSEGDVIVGALGAREAGHRVC